MSGVGYDRGDWVWVEARYGDGLGKMDDALRGHIILFPILKGREKEMCPEGPKEALFEEAPPVYFCVCVCWDR